MRNRIPFWGRPASLIMGRNADPSTGAQAPCEPLRATERTFPREGQSVAAARNPRNSAIWAAAGLSLAPPVA